MYVICKATVVVSLAQLFVLALYVAFFGYSIREGNRMVNEDARAWVMGLLLLSFYWSSQVIANVVHVTACRWVVVIVVIFSWMFRHLVFYVKHT